MAGASPKRKRIVERVMHECKTGDLERRNGQAVESRKEAIALSESGASHRRSPAAKRARRRTAPRETVAGSDRGETRASLDREAQRRDIPGRSTMRKAQLQQALR